MNRNDLPRQTTYSSYTYDAPNSLKRALHRRRYKNILKSLNIGAESRVLDYGAGDGRLFRVLIDNYGADPEKLVAFDPVPAMITEFESLVPEARVFSRCSDIATPDSENCGFDFIFCCEVFEHLTEPQVDQALLDFARLASPNTVFVIEVPIEIGPSGFAKNLFRRLKSNVDIPWSVMGKALVGLEQNRKPRITSSGEMTFEHPGYSFRTTRRILSRVLRISEEFNDPWPSAPFVFNNSRVFVARLR